MGAKVKSLARVAIVIFGGVTGLLAMMSAAVATVLEIDTMADFKADNSHATTVILESFAAWGDGGAGVFNIQSSGTCTPD